MGNNVSYGCMKVEGKGFDGGEVMVEAEVCSLDGRG